MATASCCAAARTTAWGEPAQGGAGGLFSSWEFGQHAGAVASSWLGCCKRVEGGSTLLSLPQVALSGLKKTLPCLHRLRLRHQHVSSSGCCHPLRRKRNYCLTSPPSLTGSASLSISGCSLKGRGRWERRSLTSVPTSLHLGSCGERGLESALEMLKGRGGRVYGKDVGRAMQGVPQQVPVCLPPCLPPAHPPACLLARLLASQPACLLARLLVSQLANG